MSPAHACSWKHTLSSPSPNKRAAAVVTSGTPESTKDMEAPEPADQEYMNTAQQGQPRGSSQSGPSMSTAGVVRVTSHSVCKHILLLRYIYHLSRSYLSVTLRTAQIGV
jgi:hypothetical protein